MAQQDADDVWRRAHEKRHKLPLRDGEVVCEWCQGIYAVTDTLCEKDEQGLESYWCLACYELSPG